jgi:hypothetical protein
LDGIVPPWVPRPAVHYLAHIEAGLPIRKLARDAGCHASTVLRQIRSFESRREDPLVDSALCRLGRVVLMRRDGSCRKEMRMAATEITTEPAEPLTETELERKGCAVLRQLRHPGTLLVVAVNMDKAVVVQDQDGDDPIRTDVIDKELAEAMALKRVDPVQPQWPSRALFDQPCGARCTEPDDGGSGESGIGLCREISRVSRQG